jgi:glucosamine 6-phosphate synthetase-like amidotransferase/phosphosugar isomerase protein
MGHTRHATQGKEVFNRNNHPFRGRCKNIDFALAHNGILSNDTELKSKFRFPKTKIETDSYVAVELLQYKKNLNADSLKFMAEQVKGSFTFTVLDSKNKLSFIKGDSPLTLIHFPAKKLYVYASTDDILFKAIVDSGLFEDIQKGSYEKVEMSAGDIVSLLPDGTVAFDRFCYEDTTYFNRYSWWNWGNVYVDTNAEYVNDLKSIAKSFGYTAETIDDLLSDGFTLEDIEDFIYCME